MKQKIRFGLVSCCNMLYICFCPYCVEISREVEAFYFSLWTSKSTCIFNELPISVSLSKLAPHLGEIALYIEIAAHCEQNLFKQATVTFFNTRFLFVFIYQEPTGLFYLFILTEPLFCFMTIHELQ